MIRRTAVSAVLSAAIIAAVLLIVPDRAEAVPGFTRQTTMSCNQCHTVHGGPVPNFTMTGKKFRALGYRTPHGRERITSGVEGDMGERLNLPLLDYLSFRLQGTPLSTVKPPGLDEWLEITTNPTSRVSWFFTGPVGDNFGVWNEWYIVPLGSENEEWSLGLASFDELDLRYILNPDNPDYTVGIALSNQGVDELCGFGPFPVSIGGGETSRGSILGYAHPNFGSLMLNGWMFDRWVWALGGNTGDNNLGWDYANVQGQFGYAFFNTNDNELWLNLVARSGSDVIPLVTENYVEDGERDWSYRDAIGRVSQTRPDGMQAPYLSTDVDNATSVTAEVRWSRQDWGPHSFEWVMRYGFNTEEYRDGAATDLNTLGTVFLYGWKHTYYLKPFIMTRVTHEFTDHQGEVYEIDSSPELGITFGFKPHENFLINLSWQNLQGMSVDADAESGALVRLYFDYLL